MKRVIICFLWSLLYFFGGGLLANVMIRQAHSELAQKLTSLYIWVVFPPEYPLEKLLCPMSVDSMNRWIFLFVPWLWSFCVCWFLYGMWLRREQLKTRIRMLVARRGFYPWFTVAIVLGVSAMYVALDWRHFRLNLSMHHAAQVREDCQKLLQLRNETVKESDRGMEVPNEDLPVSFHGIGACSAWVGPGHVNISLESDGWGGSWGYLYAPGLDDPKPSEESRRQTSRWSHLRRATWYHDFYEYRICGE